MNIEDKILAILNDLCGTEGDELEPNLDLFEEGLLDSFGVIALVTGLEDSFGVTLRLEEIKREQLATPQRIAALVREALA